MNSKQLRFDIDWWIVQKRYVYLLVIVLSLGVVSAAASVYVRFYGNPFGNPKGEVKELSGARFVSFDGDVRVVRAQTRENLLARSDTPLYPGDIVQTQADGRARILLADGSTLLVRPNSVVTIRDNTSAGAGNHTNVRVAVQSGQINVRTESQPEGASNIVETPLTRNNLPGQTVVSFGVRADNSEDIRVSSGKIDTTTRGGEKTTVQNGEYIAINQSGSVKSRERLLDSPAPTTPRNLEKISVAAGGAANVSLRWQRPASGASAHYRVEVAASPFFVAAGKVIERDQLEATEFGVSDLRPGVYFWRVRAVANSGQISEWSEPQKFTIAPNGGGENVIVSNLAYEYVGGNIYIARGRSQPGNTIRIDGRETIVSSSGVFQLQITTSKTAREIDVEAEDTQGNKTLSRFPFKPDAGQK